MLFLSHLQLHPSLSIDPTNQRSLENRPSLRPQIGQEFMRVDLVSLFEFSNLVFNQPHLHIKQSYFPSRDLLINELGIVISSCAHYNNKLSSRHMIFIMKAIDSIMMIFSGVTEGFVHKLILGYPQHRRGSDRSDISDDR